MSWDVLGWPRDKHSPLQLELNLQMPHLSHDLNGANRESRPESVQFLHQGIPEASCPVYLWKPICFLFRLSQHELGFLSLDREWVSICSLRRKAVYSNRYHHVMPQKTSQLEALGDWIRPERADTDMDIVSSVAQWCLSLRPMDWSTPGLPVHHQLPELAQTHVHWVSDAIQPSHPLSSPSPPTFNLSQNQDLFQWVSSSNQVAKVLQFQLQHQSFQWIFRTGKNSNLHWTQCEALEFI